MKLPPEIVGLLKTLRIADVISYLQGKRWVINSSNEKSEILKLTVGEEFYEVVLPVQRALADYVPSLAEALSTVATAEQRSIDQIVNDIMSLNKDVIRIRLEGFDTRDGTIPIEQGSQMIQKTHDLMLAAACAAIQPRSVYAAKKFDQASDYMKKVKLGQTERGSYIVTALSPLPSEQTTITNDAIEQFERQVILTFANAMSAAVTASTAALESGDIGVFDEAVQKGVSANFCEALAGLRDEDESAKVSVKISWSPNFERPQDTPENFEFTSEKIPMLVKGALHLRERSPIQDFVLKGIIVKLERDDIGPGTIYVRADNDECKARRVKIILSPEDYIRAVHAHETRSVIAIEGTLQKEGRYFSLLNHRNFSSEEVIPDQSQE